MVVFLAFRYVALALTLALRVVALLTSLLQSHQVHPTILTIIQQLCSMKQKHTKHTQINTNKSMHSEMVQCDETQSREL